MVELLVLILIIFVFGIRTSWFQTMLAQQAANFLSSKLKTEVRIDKVDFVFVDLIDIEGVYVEDKLKDTLLYAQTIHVDIDAYDFSTPSIDIEEVTLSNATVKLQKYEGDSTLNFQHIVDYFASESKDTSSTKFKLNVESVVLDNINFRYRDENAPSQDFGMNYSDIGIQHLSGKFSDFGMEEGTINAKVEKSLVPFGVINFKLSDFNMVLFNPISSSLKAILFSL